MDEHEVGKYWEGNAETWTRLVRAGGDAYRDYVNTPAFLEMLPDVSGLRGLDIGCGEGHNTRLLAARGARMIGLDIAPTFIRHAQEQEQAAPQGIEYCCGSAHQMPYADASFDFAVAFMSLMDMPDPNLAIAEAQRILRPDGFLQFSILHPCFQTTRWRWVEDDEGTRIGVVCGDYFALPECWVERWKFGPVEGVDAEDAKPFAVPRFYRTLSWWLNTLLEAGFRLERLGEPCADEEAARQHPAVADSRIVPHFLHVRARRD